jgi:hypothetical protein
MSKAYDSKNNLFVTVVSTSSGWTTVLSENGVQYKLRNSQVEAVKNAPAAALIKEAVKNTPAAISDDMEKKNTRTCGNATYNINDYVKVKSSNGNTSMDKGDALAIKLRQFNLDGVYKYAAVELGVPEKELRARYAHLNPGLARMALGNRIRAI